MNKWDLIYKKRGFLTNKFDLKLLYYILKKLNAEFVKCGNTGDDLSRAFKEYYILKPKVELTITIWSNYFTVTIFDYNTGHSLRGKDVLTVLSMTIGYGY
jgi:hypothetical protein